jgi:ferrous iron transport protein B
MGNPNVGKSVVFSRLTGVNVIASNYPGTTVEFKKGKMKLDEQRVEVIDVPGAYSLEPTTKAEEVAVEMLKEGDVVIDVVDATNLERNLYFTLQLREKEVPIIVALNLWDEAKHKGIKIDVERLEKLLGIPIVPTVAVTGEGINELVSSIPTTAPPSKTLSDDERWAEVGRITKEVQQVTHRHHTALELLGDASVKPLTGIPIAILIMLLTFGVVRLVGEGLIGYLFDPIFKVYNPLALKLSDLIGSGLLHDILIGELVDGEIGWTESMGLLTTGLYVPFAMVLPYVFAFYLVLGILEDSGYLPRLAVLIDTLMHRIGLHGLAIVPMMLGLGCNVPGALSTRVLETKKQRFIAATLMAIAVPCMAQIAMIFGLVGKVAGTKGLIIVFLTFFLVWIALGLLLKRAVKGECPEIFMDVPPYRAPSGIALLKKLWMRIRSFLTTAIPFVFLGVFIVNLLYSLGIIQAIGNVFAPLMTEWLGLPQDAVGALIIGFLRKDVAVGMLLPLGLTSSQAIVASVVLAMYFPCVATFVVLVRELGPVDMLKSTGIMIVSALLVGGLLNILLWV